MDKFKFKIDKEKITILVDKLSDETKKALKVVEKANVVLRILKKDI